MDEMYMGSIIFDMQGDVGTSGNGSVKDKTETLFVNLAKDKNEYVVVKSTSFFEYVYL
jgi:hypothetical protein